MHCVRLIPGRGSWTAAIHNQDLYSWQQVQTWQMWLCRNEFLTSWQRARLNPRPCCGRNVQQLLELFTAKAEIKTFFLRAPSRHLGPTKLFPSRLTGHRWLHRLVSLEGFAAVTFSSCPINTEVSSKPLLLGSFYLSLHLWLFWGLWITRVGLFGIAQP